MRELEPVGRRAGWREVVGGLDVGRREGVSISMTLGLETREIVGEVVARWKEAVMGVRTIFGQIGKGKRGEEEADKGVMLSWNPLEQNIHVN